jgi:hypothetical protein
MRHPRRKRSLAFCVTLAWLLVLGLATPGVTQQPPSDEARVRLVGAVRDEFNAFALPGVSVEIKGVNAPASSVEVIVTDLDGRFVASLLPGAYEIRISMDGYQERTLKMDVAAGQRSINAEIGLSTNRFAETVTVTGQVTDLAVASTEAQLVQRMRSTVVQDNLGAEEMRQNGDSDAAAAMQRVTGMSVIDNQFLYVRGLGERYSNTTLNGAVIPTTEPDRKVVPLDLFPSGLLSSVTVAKSYSPDRSADFAGGLVEIVPLKFPGRTQLEMSWNMGFNSLTAGENVPGYLGGGGDWRGFDNGTRALPSAVPDRKVIRGGIYTPDVGLLGSDLQRIGRAFPNNWNLLSRSTKPNQSGSVTFGSRLGSKVGVLLSYTQSYKEQFNEERQVFYRSEGGDALSEFSDYQFQFATRRANVGAVGNVSVQPTGAHRFTWENFYTHSGKDETRTFEGFNSDIATDIRNQRFLWVEEDLLSTGVAGEHYFSNLASSRIDWRVTRSGASRDEPDLREVLYERNGDVFVLADESQSGLRMFNTLSDDTTDGTASWSLFNSVNGLPAQFKFGGQYVHRTRDFTSRRFRMIPLNTSGVTLTAQPEDIFAEAHIGPNYEIKEETRVTDTYAGEQNTASGFGMVDLAFSSATRLIAGARVERFEQQVDTFDLFDFEGDPDIIRATIDETDIFPGVNFVYSPRPEQNLRLSFSQTVNRPEFREVAPFEFTDVVGGRAVVGNPALRRALIQNYDVRYEVFPGAEEVIAASFFFKRFNDPIERIVEPTAQLRTSFTNADSARNVGIELEARARAGSDNFLVGANYTFVDSNVSLTPAAAQVQTSLERPLSGQSKNLFNLSAEARGRGISGRVLYNFFGKRISDVGSQGLPDIIEDGRGSLDFILAARVASRLNIRFSADNLTDEDFEFTQGGRIQRLFNLGRTFTLNFGFSAF